MSSVVHSRKSYRIIITSVLIAYALMTIAPFYVLFIRSFVSTAKSTDIHLWIPRSEPIDLDARIGHLSVYFNLDFDTIKDELGIPENVYIPPQSTLLEIAKEYDVSKELIQDYFSPFSVYNGWITLLQSRAYWRAVGITLLITVLSLIFLNLLSVMTGYGLASLDRRDKRFIYNAYIIQLLLPPMLLLLPEYMIVQWILNLLPDYKTPGLQRSLGQIFAIVLIWAKGGALTTMIFTSFISKIPKELEESAQIDGASRFQYFRYVLIPLLKVPIATVTVIMLPIIWNSFLTPYVYLDFDNTTILPLLQSFTGQYSTNYQIIYSGVFISILPLFIIYLVFQKRFVSNLLAGAVKG